MPSSAILFLLLQLPLHLRLVVATCYFPNGDTSDDHLTCTSSSGTSICCAEGFECLSNGLCADPRYDNFERVLRGACTDKSWGSGCTGFCNTDWPDRDETVYFCGDGKWCCASRECCDENNGIMTLGSPSVVAIAGQGEVNGGGNNNGESSKTEEQAPSTKAPDPEPTTSKNEEQQQTKEQSDEKTALSSQVAQVHVTQPTSTSEKVDANDAEKTSSGSPKSTEARATTKSDSGSASATAKPATVTVVQDGQTKVIVSSTPPTPTPSFTRDNVYKGSKNTIALGVGIGIGVALLLFALLFGGWWYMRRRKRTQQHGVMHRSIDANPFERRDYVVELEGDGVPELHGGRELGEMDGKGREKEKEKARISRHELDGSDAVRAELGKERDMKTWPL